MRDEVNWLTDALSRKNIAREMTHYRIEGGEIRATDGRITAGHPFPHDGPFLVPGKELETLVKRFDKDITIEMGDEHIIVKSARSRAKIKTLPIEEWNYPGIDEDGWQDVPDGLVSALNDLRPFVSDNATQIWSMGVCLYHGYAYATNNVCLAGVRCEPLGEIEAILPLWAADFITDRENGLVEWQWTQNYVAFRWDNGAWMRAQLIDSKFPEQAMRMVLAAEQMTPSVEMSEEFRSTLNRTFELCKEVVRINGSIISGSFGEASYEDEMENTSFENESLWAIRYLKPVVDVATHWEPNLYPKPVNFRGDRIFGYVVGRKS